MSSTFVLLGYTIPVYGLCWLIGITLSALTAFVIKPKNASFETYDLVCGSVLAVVGGLIGSKLLFVLVSLRSIIENSIPLEGIIKGGFVFYGGLLGGIAGVFTYTKKFRIQASHITDILATVLPLGHAVGRVGCHFGGCCYGMEYDGLFSVTYYDTLGSTPLGVGLFPVQLLEAVLLLVLFACLLIVYKKTKDMGVATVVYLYGYAVIRFLLEFLRGDKERGALLGLSTSQIISVVIVCIVSFVIVRGRKRERKMQ